MMVPPEAILCYVTDRNSLEVPAAASREAALLERIAAAAAAGIDWIQLREKDLDAKPLLDLARAAVSASRLRGATSPRILINDRLDVAAAAGAHGVHLSETSLPVAEVVRWKHQVKRPDFLVGVSCHSLQGARQAARDGADYIFFGPVFATPSKAAFGPPQGLPQLAEVCAAIAVPVIAVGGVGVENAPECRQAGAAGIAAIRLFQNSAGLLALVQGLHQALANDLTM